MIKKCNVLNENGKVTVVDCDGVNVQIPTSTLEDGFGYVKCEKGNYAVTTKAEYLKENAKKKPKKKIETVYIVEDTVTDNVIDTKEWGL